MRVIKFRAWHKVLREMFTVAHLHFGIEGLTKIETSSIASDSWQLSDIDLMQYTGLKDCKGQEIYEGDIVRFGLDNEDNDRIGAIGYTFSDFVIISLARKFPDIGLSDATRLEVIGNIYQNVKFPGED